MLLQVHSHELLATTDISMSHFLTCLLFQFVPWPREGYHYLIGAVALVAWSRWNALEIRSNCVFLRFNAQNLQIWSNSYERLDTLNIISFLRQRTMNRLQCTMGLLDGHHHGCRCLSLLGFFAHRPWLTAKEPRCVKRPNKDMSLSMPRLVHAYPWSLLAEEKTAPKWAVLWFSQLSDSFNVLQWWHICC